MTLGNLKQERIQDKKWLAFAVNMNCVVCGRSNTSMHHLREGSQCGMGLKSPDNFCLPLCENTINHIGCHTKIHKSHKKFVADNEKVFLNDIEGFCNDMYSKYKLLKNKEIGTILHR